MRKLLGIIFLLALVAGAWYLVRWMRGPQELQATLLMRSATPLRAGDPVTNEGITIGTVTLVSRLERDDAVSIRIDGQHRDAIRRDSLYAVRKRGGGGELAVVNTVAVGPPVADGAVIRPPDQKAVRWIADRAVRMGELVEVVTQRAGDLVREYESGALKQKLDDYERKLPGWKASGEEVAKRNMAALQQRVAAMEKALREEKRFREADALRKRFAEWAAAMKAKTAATPHPADVPAAPEP